MCYCHLLKAYSQVSPTIFILISGELPNPPLRFPHWLQSYIKPFHWLHIYIYIYENYANMQHWGIIKEIKTQKGIFQVKSPLTPNNAHFMHCNSALPLVFKNDLRWTVWLPLTTTIALMWKPCHHLHKHKVKCWMKPNDMRL